jgi:hypothetical protein
MPFALKLIRVLYTSCFDTRIVPPPPDTLYLMPWASSCDVTSPASFDESPE